MRKQIVSAMALCLTWLCLGLASCTDEALVEVATEQGTGEPFMLTASSGDDSRLALGQDGLSVKWEPGDQLVLVDKSKKLAPIYLNCTLNAPASSANFVAETGVPAGDYWVIYNYNENLVYGHNQFMSIDNINDSDKLAMWGEIKVSAGDSSASIQMKHIYAKVKVTLKNAPSANYGDFQVGMYASKGGFPMYKQFTANGFENAEYGYNPNPNYQNQTTYFASKQKLHNVRLGQYRYYQEEVEGGAMSGVTQAEMAERSALILPEDVSGGTLFFYILEGENKCYEIAKENIKFEAGKSYKVVLDMAAETTVVTTLKSNQVILPGQQYETNVFQLSTPAECRAAAYRNRGFEGGNYQLTADIDFENEVFLPFCVRYLHGNDKKLKNISIDWEEEDYVGILRYDDVYTVPLNYGFIVSNLTLENITIKGNNYVGALGGCNIHATNCQIIGNSSITGKGDNVGGFVGANRFDIHFEMVDLFSVSKSSIAETCTVQGANQVGGIIGQFMKVNSWTGPFYASWTALESCTSAATVTASGDYVGGIFGQMGGNYYVNNYGSDNVSFTSEDFTVSLSKCVNKGDVNGKDYVGGIGGDFKLYCNNGVDRVVLKQSSSEGTVSGSSYVGGILGASAASINTCYSMDAISASTSEVGGILGKWNEYGRVANCYSLADLTVGNNGVAGGIVGNGSTDYLVTDGVRGKKGVTVINSYFAGTNVATGSGIIGKSEGGCSVTNCLTTLANLGTSLGNHQVPTGAPDSDGDGVADYDWNGDGVIDNNDMYYNYPDIITNSAINVTSILANKAVINGDNAYSDDYWNITKYPYYCVKFADFSGDINAPDFGNSDIEI